MRDFDLDEKLRTAAELGRKLAELMRKLPQQGAVTRPDSIYMESLKQLERGVSNIAFCGKVNSGKSTLLNSIIGRKVLPTGNLPVTSRIVEIENCASREEEQVALILHDGYAKVYSGLGKLAQFAVEHGKIEEDEAGVQLITAKIDGIDLNRVAMIQVRCHMPHFPSGFRLVDTPGIGASYKEHGALSYMYLERAHAVVYVMKSDTLLVQEDVPFVTSVLESNKNIIFVQSCADDYSPQTVQDIRTRNLQLINKLRKSSGGEGNTVRYFVLAAKNVLTPACGEAQRERCQLYAAQYEEFMTGWKWMLYQTAGADLLMRALECCGAYIQENLAFFKERLEIVRREDSAAAKCLESARRARLFREKWIGGGDGSAYCWNSFIKRLENNVNLAAGDMVTYMNQLQSEELARLDAVSSKKDAETFMEGTSEKVQAAWIRVQKACVERINKSMLELRDVSPSLLDRKDAAGRVVGRGVLVPLKIEEAGVGDLLRIGVGLFRTLAGDIFGGLCSLGRSIWGFFARENRNARAIAECKNKLNSQMDSIRNALSKKLDQKSKNNPLSVYFQQAVKQSRDAIMARYQTLLSEASAQYVSASAGEGERRAIMNMLQGDNGKSGLIAVWEKGESWVYERIEEVKTDKVS